MGGQGQRNNPSKFQSRVPSTNPTAEEMLDLSIRPSVADAAGKEQSFYAAYEVKLGAVAIAMCPSYNCLPLRPTPSRFTPHRPTLAHPAILQHTSLHPSRPLPTPYHLAPPPHSKFRVRASGCRVALRILSPRIKMGEVLYHSTKPWQRNPPLDQSGGPVQWAVRG